MHPINPGPGFWRPDAASHDSKRVILTLIAARTETLCPDCRRPSRRIHSRYWRRGWGLPVTGTRVELRIQARRFFCEVRSCGRRIFCERFPGILEPYSRWTERARTALLEISHANSAESIARLVGMMGFRVSHDSLLRLQRREVFSFEQAPVIAMDEFAWRKRQRYGTLIVDLKGRRPIDLLPTDKTEEVSEWLKQHEPITVIARDRDNAFAKAANAVAPGALQVADRFHLVKNVMEALHTVVHSRRWEVPDPPTGAPRNPEPPLPDLPSAPVASKRQPTARKQRLWDQVKELSDKGWTYVDIGRAVGISRKTASEYMRVGVPTAYGDRRMGRSGPLGTYSPFIPYLEKRWAEGVHDIGKLHKEVRSQGYEASVRTLRRSLRPWRLALPARTDKRSPPPDSLLFRWKGSLTDEEVAKLDPYLEKM